MHLTDCYSSLAQVRPFSYPHVGALCKKQNTRPPFSLQQKTLHTLTVDLQSHTGSTRNQIHTVLHRLLSDQSARGRCFVPQCTHLFILPPLLSVSGYCFLPARSLLVCLSHYSTFCPAVIVDLNDIKGSAVRRGISCCVLMIREHTGVWLLIRCVSLHGLVLCVCVCATVAARPNACSGCQRWRSQRHELTGAIGLWLGSFSTPPSHLMLRHHFCSEQIHRFPLTCCTYAVLLLLQQTFLPFFLCLDLSFSLSLSLPLLCHVSPPPLHPCVWVQRLVKLTWQYKQGKCFFHTPAVFMATLTM